MTRYEDYIDCGKRKHGTRFSDAALAPQFIAAYNSGQRISVGFVSCTTGEVYEVRRGTVGVTTGWVPCFLLMGRKSDKGSSYPLNAKDKIVSMDAWRKYKESES